MNKIIIENLECFGKHGVFKEENVLGQKFVVSAAMITNDVKDDDINNAVDYGAVSHYIADYVSNNVFKLIETLANNMAENILKKFNISEITIKVKKPFAPIGLPLDTAAVEVNKKWSVAYLSIGSNIGDKKSYLDMCIKELENNENIKIEKIADFITTKAYGYTEQDDFLNSAIKIKTILSPYELLDYTSSIEEKAHREREIHWGPRTLDIDILLYENVVLDDKKLTIPHLDMHNREFVLKPMCQIAPYEYHNVLNKSILELYMNLQNKI
jgi:2-amino-4-hydroxy-6-hydroxymethyldihydropteridine diphosphokinase